MSKFLLLLLTTVLGLATYMVIITVYPDLQEIFYTFRRCIETINDASGTAREIEGYQWILLFVILFMLACLIGCALLLVKEFKASQLPLNIKETTITTRTTESKPINQSAVQAKSIPHKDGKA